MQISLPRDIRLLQTVRSLAVQATRHAGCTDPRADAFVASVEAIAKAHLEDTAATGDIPVVVRINARPLEIRIATRTVTLDI